MEFSGIGSLDIRAGSSEIPRMAKKSAPIKDKLNKTQILDKIAASTALSRKQVAAVLDGPLTGPVNVGNPDEFTMRELAELVVELVGSGSPIVLAPMPPEREGDPLQRRPDITLIRSQLGWEPSVSLRSGLQLMIDEATRQG